MRRRGSGKEAEGGGRLEASSEEGCEATVGVAGAHLCHGHAAQERKTGGRRGTSLEYRDMEQRREKGKRIGLHT